ncbi:MAG: radical SAM protein [Planctomycetota bacterium]
MSELRVSEIYPSVQGESTLAGWPCVFVRLTGCPLRCVWCDTAYAFSGGETLPIDEIVRRALEHGLPMVEVTGGEPLAQRAAPLLLAQLADRFATVLLETSGAYPIAGLDPRVRVILDLKAPGSGEERRNKYENLAALKPGDELKIVIADRGDYDWARATLRERPIPDFVPLHISPVHGKLHPREVVAWLLADRWQAHLQLQQHKYIWPPETRGV